LLEGVQTASAARCSKGVHELALGYAETIEDTLEVPALDLMLV
jgi:hypothetical protein